MKRWDTLFAFCAFFFINVFQYSLIDNRYVFQRIIRKAITMHPHFFGVTMLLVRNIHLLCQWLILTGNQLFIFIVGFRFQPRCYLQSSNLRPCLKIQIWDLASSIICNKVFYCLQFLVSFYLFGSPSS